MNVRCLFIMHLHVKCWWLLLLSLAQVKAQVPYKFDGDAAKT